MSQQVGRRLSVFLSVVFVLSVPQLMADEAGLVAPGATPMKLADGFVFTEGPAVDANGNVTTAGETQVYGFDLSVNDSLVMPVRKEYEAHDDPTLLRQQKQGFFGWEEVGFALLDSRMVSLGVIDRS